VTIALHIEGASWLLTATDTQETYTSGEKVESGKIISYGRAQPLGSISIAGSGDSEYIRAASQELERKFQRSSAATVDELETELRDAARGFYTEHVLPFVGKFDDENVPDYSLLVAATHGNEGKLWNVERTMMTDAALYDCIGAGKPAADSLLNRLYPLYPTLDSLAILAAYVIYRVKNTVDGCGLKTEIRFIKQGTFGIGIVPPDRIDRWEGLFRKYDRLEREVFYHAMNFMVSPPVPRFPTLPELPAFPPQMKPLPEIAQEIGEIRAEFAKLPILKPPQAQEK